MKNMIGTDFVSRKKERIEYYEKKIIFYIIMYGDCIRACGLRK